MLDTMIVIAKEPAEGRVKTRLCPPLSYQQAADIAAAALSDTLRVASMVPAHSHVLAFDGAVEQWLPTGWSAVTQSSGGLDERLVNALAAVGSGPAVLVGMDTPQLSVQQVLEFDTNRYDACLGMSTDGGFWTIGFRRPRKHAALIRGVPMSSRATGRAQLVALEAAGLRVQLLDELTDVDTFADATYVAQRHPAAPFSAAVRALPFTLVG